MKIKASSRMNIDTLILLLLFFQITVFSLLNIRGLGNRLIVLVVFVRVFAISKNGKFQLKTILLFLLLWASFSLSAFKGKSFDTSIYMGNFTAIVYTLAPAIYIGWLAKYRRGYLKNLFDECFDFFNIFYAINYIVMLIQGVIPGFLAGLSDHVNTFVPDLMSGLFGYEATPQFGLYSIFIVLYDLYSFNHSQKHRITNRSKRICVSILLIASVIIAATLNENKAVYITLLIALFQYYLVSTSGMKQSKRMKAVSGTIIAVVALYFFLMYMVTVNIDFFYSISPQLGGTVYLIRRLMNDITSYNSGATGSIERVYMLIYVFFHPEYIPFGAGTAYSYWQTSGTLGFSHFGQSDMSSFLCLGGLAFCIICFLVYFYFYRCVLGTPKNNKSICIAAHVVSILFYYFYTQPWTQSTLSICIVLTLIPLGMLTENLSPDKSRTLESRNYNVGKI